MADLSRDEIAAYVDAAARLIGLPVDAAYRDQVIANMERTQQIASLALAEPLADDLLAAPVFRP
jgi:hypothetical protein